MKFIVDKLPLTAGGLTVWSDAAPPQRCCETDGVEADQVLTTIVRHEGGVELGIRASYADGHAITVARKGTTVYALRAKPAGRE